MDEATLERFFCHGMAQGWVAGAPYSRIWEQLPGHKAFRFTNKEAGLTLVDSYCVNPATRGSAGTTLIYHEGVPVWSMSYRGVYKKAAIPFLKELLLEQYSRGIFCGGRGPVTFKSTELGLGYINEVRGVGFERFSGHEMIVRLNGPLLGYHDSQGGML